jgi:hypothetical protein
MNQFLNSWCEDSPNTFVISLLSFCGDVFEEKKTNTAEQLNSYLYRRRDIKQIHMFIRWWRVFHFSINASFSAWSNKQWTTLVDPCCERTNENGNLVRAEVIRAEFSFPSNVLQIITQKIVIALPCCDVIVKGEVLKLYSFATPAPWRH